MFRSWRLRSRAQGMVLLWGACCVFAAAQAQPVLTLERALELALARSRQLPAQDAAALAAREMAVAAAQLPDPVLKAGIANLPVEGPHSLSLGRDFMTMRSIGVMQEFTRADKRHARATRYAREADVAAAARAETLAELQRNTAAAWLERYYLERLRDEQAALRHELALQIDAAGAAYRGGRGSQADVFAARAAVARVDDALLQTGRQTAQAQARLARWVGAAADQALGPPPVTDRLPLALHELVERLESHPRAEWMHRQEAVAAAQAEIARSNQRADWSAELMFSQRGSGYANMVSVNLTLPLRWDPARRQDRELAAALAVQQKIRDEREEFLRELEATTRASALAWQHNRRRLALFDSALRPLAAERTRATLAAYRGGSGILVDVLEARRMEIEIRTEQLRLELETADLWASLAYLLPAPSTTPATEEQRP